VRKRARRSSRRSCEQSVDAGPAPLTSARKRRREQLVRERRRREVVRRQRREIGGRRPRRAREQLARALVEAVAPSKRS
jgi:hypothetical protein